MAAVAVLAASNGCADRLQPCMSASACGQGMECLANRCVVRGADPVPDAADRHVIEPRQRALVSDLRRPGEPAQNLVVGNAVHGDATLLLAFDLPALAGQVSVAFLVLDPVRGAPAGQRDIEVTLYSILEPWQEQTLSPVALPQLGAPSARGIARAAPPSVLRVDVTELVRASYQASQDHHGFALTAPGGSGHGATFQLSQGQGPRLELYVK